MRNTSLSKSLRLLAAPIVGMAIGAIFASCEDTVSKIGNELASGEVQIALDSLTWDGSLQSIYRGNQTFQVTCDPIEYTTYFDGTVDTRSTTNLLGRISVPEYGDLNCSFVTQLLSTKRLDIPESIPLTQIDSMKLILYVPRGELTGDSLAPQQLKVYKLTKSLPKDIDNRFDPKGSYDPTSPLGSRTFTLSALGMSDSIYQKKSYINIEIPLPKEWAVKVVEAYRDSLVNSVFEWPQSFEDKFHGIYVEPSFGRGCVANISLVDFVIFYNYEKTEASYTDGAYTPTVTTETGYAGVFATSPIVLSSNNVSYKPSQYLEDKAAANEAIITTPGGFRINLTFPAEKLLEIYQMSQSKLSVISDLKFSIPAEEIENEYGLTPPPYLVLVRTSKLQEFLSSNSLPDEKDSFYATYDSKKKEYEFSSMRNYILRLAQNGVQEDDLDFTIIPANIVFETSQSSSSSSYYDWLYGVSSTASETKYPTKCTPYIVKPTMCRLKMDQARTIFTYSTQQMK